MSGKNILIAGIGELGKSLSYDLLLQNNHVIINSRNQEKLKEIVSEYSIYGSIRSIAMELKDEESCKALIDGASKYFKSLDSLVVMVGGFMEDPYAMCFTAYFER